MFNLSVLLLCIALHPLLFFCLSSERVLSEASICCDAEPACSGGGLFVKNIGRVRSDHADGVTCFVHDFDLSGSSLFYDTKIGQGYARVDELCDCLD